MALVLTPAGLFVQTITTGTAGVGNTASFNFYSAPWLTIAVGGTLTSMTLTFEASIDGTTWFALSGIKADGTYVATTTAAGVFAFQNTGLTAVRARCTTYSSGAADCMAMAAPTPH